MKKTKVDEGKRAEIKMCAYLAEHKIAFRISDHLIEVCRSSFSDSKIAEKLKLGRTKATAIDKNVIGKYEGETLADKLKLSKFSLIIDESTDIGCNKNLAVCVRYFDFKTDSVETKFWKLLPVFLSSDDANIGATGERLFQLVVKALQKEEIPFANVIGFASGGCNVMMGEKDSVSSRLRESFPGICIMKCICHSLHLCANETCKNLPRRCEDLCRDVFNFF